MVLDRIHHLSRVGLIRMYFHINRCVTLHIKSIQELEVDGKKHISSDTSRCEWLSKMEKFENLEIRIALKWLVLKQVCSIDYN